MTGRSHRQIRTIRTHIHFNPHSFSALSLGYFRSLLPRPVSGVCVYVTRNDLFSVEISQKDGRADTRIGVQLAIFRRLAFRI